METRNARRNTANSAISLPFNCLQLSEISVVSAVVYRHCSHSQMQILWLLAGDGGQKFVHSCFTFQNMNVRCSDFAPRCWRPLYCLEQPFPVCSDVRVYPRFSLYCAAPAPRYHSGQNEFIVVITLTVQSRSWIALRAEIEVCYHVHLAPIYWGCFHGYSRGRAFHTWRKSARSPAETPRLECCVVGDAMPCDRDRERTVAKHFMLLSILKKKKLFT
jgi:hypothetical protein